jgi:hypothetical protein
MLVPQYLASTVLFCFVTLHLLPHFHLLLGPPTHCDEAEGCHQAQHQHVMHPTLYVGRCSLC